MKSKFRLAGTIIGIIACIAGIASYLSIDARRSVSEKNGSDTYNVQAEIEKALSKKAQK